MLTPFRSNALAVITIHTCPAPLLPPRPLLLSLFCPQLIELDFTACKNNDTISYFCCRGGTCTTASCNDVPSNGTKCEEVGTSLVLVPFNATSVSLQGERAWLIDWSCERCMRPT